MMDIFKWADDMGWNCDYYDVSTGYLYHIQEAKLINNTNAIRVTDSGKEIGYVYRY